MDLWWPQCESIQQGNSRHLLRMPISSVYFLVVFLFLFPFLFFFILFFFLTFQYFFFFLYSFEGLLTKNTNSLFFHFFSQKHNQQAPP